MPKKSFKVDTRNRAKHSDKLLAAGKQKRKERHGWGDPIDDAQATSLDTQMKNRNSTGTSTEEEEMWRLELARQQPFLNEANNRFGRTCEDLRSFKKQVRAALRQYIVSYEVDEFQTTLEELDRTIYHQELSSIIMRQALDFTHMQREKCCALIVQLQKRGCLTQAQTERGLRKLFADIAEVEIDVPHAKTLLREGVQFLKVAHAISPSLVDEMQQHLDLMARPDHLKMCKRIIHDAVAEFFDSHDYRELLRNVTDLAFACRFEWAKMLIRLACDLQPEQQELCCRAIAYLEEHGALTPDDCLHACNRLLVNVEDLVLDYPLILSVLSCVFARLTIDELVPPNWLERTDVSDSDVALNLPPCQVLSATTDLVRDRDASQYLPHIFVPVSGALADGADDGTVVADDSFMHPGVSLVSVPSSA